jgi:hypothetical protein
MIRAHKRRVFLFLWVVGWPCSSLGSVLVGKMLEHFRD